MSLATELRPKDYEDIIGNKDIVKDLILRVSFGKKLCPHTFLFIGPPGCGKTTLARITAKMCGADEKLGIIELNAANTNGINTIREIDSTMDRKPLHSDAIAYIIDESQQLTAAAQEALLKMTEEPPSYIYFFFCTTEPEKLKQTLKDRAGNATFVVSPLDSDESEILIRKVCVKLNRPLISSVVIERIIVASEGVPRKIINILEKLLSGKKTPQEMIEIISKGNFDADSTGVDLARTILKGNGWNECRKILLDLRDDSESVRRTVLNFLNKALLKEEQFNKRQAICEMIIIFSESTYYSGKPLLSAMTYQACLINSNKGVK